MFPGLHRDRSTLVTHRKRSLVVQKIVPPSATPSSLLDLIRSNIALSMIGRVVDLMVSAEKITHGLVTAVFIENDVPKIVVNGSGYDLSQVLTVVPASLN